MVYFWLLQLELSTQQNLCQIELKRLEDELLSKLSAAEGNFLRDTALVEQLEYTKNTARHIHNKVWSKLSIYLVVACSDLFFCIVHARWTHN